MTKITIIAFAIMLLNACKKDMSSDTMISEEVASKTNAEKEKISVPMKVVLYSSANPASPALTCTMPGVPFGIANSGYFLHGTATHVGLVNSETSIGIDGFCNLSATTFILSTTTSGEIVAADGSKITYTGNDEIDLNNIIFQGATTGTITGLWTITGGTGRFDGASGSFQINGIVDLTAAGGPAFSITGEGTITY